MSVLLVIAAIILLAILFWRSEPGEIFVCCIPLGLIGAGIALWLHH